MSRLRLIALLLALVTCAIYLPAGQHGFSIFDDNDYVGKNEVVQSGLTWHGVRWAFTTSRTGNWMPLTWISHMAVCQLFGLKPGAHHLVNVLLHAVNVVLLLVLLFRLTNALWPSIFAVALFAWHPLHVESVAWIAERKGMLSAFFGLATLLAYTRYAQGQLKAGNQDVKISFILSLTSPVACYFVALIFFALSLMSKPMLVTLPFVMLLLDYWPLQRIPITKGDHSSALMRLTFEKWPFFMLSAVLCTITFLAQRAESLVDSLAELPMGDRLGNVPLAYSRYLLQMIWPTHLAVYYTFPNEISPLALVAVAFVLLLISATVWLGRKRSPYWFVGWLWFLGTLVPVIGLVSVGGVAMANRYAYFPSIGIFLAVALSFRDGVARFRVSTKIVVVLASVVLAACLGLTENQLHYWRDDVSLFSHAIDVTKDTRWVHFRHLGFLHNRLGFALDNEGRKTDAIIEYRTALMLEPDYADAYDNLGVALARQGKLPEAIEQYERALQLKPNFADAHDNLGVTLASQGKLTEAIEHYMRALQLKPDFAGAYCNLGVALASQGRLTEAIEQYERALQLKPNFAGAYCNLGIALARQGKLSEAVQHFERALQIEPDFAEAHYNLGNALDYLGMALAAEGQFAEAIRNYRRAIQANPDRPEIYFHLGMALGQSGRTRDALVQYQEALRLNPELAGALNNLAWILATSSDDGLRNGAEAIRLAERACELTHHDKPLYIGTLAAAYAEAGRFSEAVATAERAEQLATKAGLTAVAEKNRQALEFYRTGKSYHEPQ